MSNTQNSDGPETLVLPKPAKKKGSGRKVGSYCFVKIPLSELIAKFADHSTPMIVGRKWAEQLGFSGLVANPVGATMDAIIGQTPASRVGVTVTEDDE